MNLFVVSNMGQLYQAQALIRKEALNNNVLAILYTNMNTKIFDYLLGSVDNELFTHTEAVLLPNHPNNFTVKKLNAIRSSYENLFEKYQIQKVFICSFESHYNYLKDITLERNAKLALFEEGTATYKLLVNNPEEQQLPFKQRVKRAIRISKNDFKKAYKNSFLAVVIKRSFILQSIKALFKTGKRLLAAFLTKNSRNNIKTKVYPKKLKSAFRRIEEFDEVYVAFPDKARKVFKSKSFNELISDYSLNKETTRLINENEAIKGLNSNSIVFVNQKYNVPVKIHVEIILSFLVREFNDEKIFIKFHPKDTRAMKEAFLKGIINKGIAAEIIDLDIEVPFESILKVKKPKLVIGITSTSLIYSKKILPDTTAISCANSYISEIVKKRVDNKTIETVKFHREILESLSDIEIR
jgi:poly-alpha-2,8 sialosyl sialyltransferase